MAEILGVGEVLWDIFPSGKILGGAPANFVFHCRQLGHEARMVSRVGADDWGRELLADLDRRGVPTDLIQRDPVHPTGTVRVEMSGTTHRFIITDSVAWDYLAPSPALADLARRSAALCFGSLAQRSPASRDAIRSLVTACRGIIVCDINLRQHFYSQDVIASSLEASTVLKLNDEELLVLKDLLGIGGQDTVAIARDLLRRYELDLVCVTRGPHGAMLVGPHEVAEHPGVSAKIADTVGCGDAFTAVLVDGLLRQKPLTTIAEHANRVGAFVASQPGATPPWPAELKQLVTT